jgi:hypothetical protein
MSMSSADDTDSTEKSGCEYDSDLNPDVDMRMADDVNAPDGGDLDGDLHMERDSDNDEEDNEEKEDEEKEDEEEDKDDHDGKEPQTIGQGEMVNTSADDADTLVDDKPTVLPEQGQEIEQGQEMCEHTPRPQPPAPAPRPQTLEPLPQPRTPETHTLSGLEVLGLVMPQKPRLAALTLRQGEAAGNTSEVNLEQ